MDATGEGTDVTTGIDGELVFMSSQTNDYVLSVVCVVLASVTVLCTIPYLLQCLLW